MTTKQKEKKESPPVCVKWETEKRFAHNVSVHLNTSNLRLISGYCKGQTGAALTIRLAVETLETFYKSRLENPYSSFLTFQERCCYNIEKIGLLKRNFWKCNNSFKKKVAVKSTVKPISLLAVGRYEITSIWGNSNRLIWSIMQSHAGNSAVGFYIGRGSRGYFASSIVNKPVKLECQQSFKLIELLRWKRNPSGSFYVKW